MLNRNIRPPDHPPGFGKNRTFYTIRTKCNNCKEVFDIEIPKGTSVKDYISEIECENCGCRTLVKK